MQDVIKGALHEAERLLSQLRADASAMDSLSRATELCVETFRNGGKLLACGNGGSMADAMHFAEEWSGRFRADRPPYAAIALSDPAHLTCVANDYGFEQVFARQVRALGRAGDTLLVLSTSGASPNILATAREAKFQGMKVIGFLGRGGGVALELCDVAFVAPGETADRIQELHMLCLHALIEAAEKELGH